MFHDLKPLDAPWPEAVRESLQRYYPDRDGEYLSLFRVFARSPRLLAKLGAAGLLDERSPLPLREREIVILRVTANKGCEYEWGVHVTVFRKAAGFTPEQVAASRTGPADAACWNEREQWLLSAVDQLGASGVMGADTREAFGRLWDAEQQLEILALTGFYTTVSHIANTAALPREAWAASFPSP